MYSTILVAVDLESLGSTYQAKLLEWTVPRAVAMQIPHLLSSIRRSVKYPSRN